MLMQFMLVGDLNREPPPLPPPIVDDPISRNDQLYFLYILLAIPISMVILILGISLAFLLRRFYVASTVIKNGDGQISTPYGRESSVLPVSVNSSTAIMEDHEVQLPTMDPEDYAKLIDVESK